MTELPSTLIEADLAAAFSRQKAHHPRVRAATSEERIEKLQALRRALVEHRTAIHQAVFDDFHKPAEESDLTELSVVLAEIDHACRHLKQWMLPSSRRTPLKLIGARAEIHYEPRGVVLIIAPWNYPFNLTLGPLVSAVAAGNCVLLKPSEFAPHSASLLSWILSEIFPPEEVTVVQGGALEAAALLELPFDHIFFTGSSAIGKKVMMAAARHLTSMTLELGGKSPAIVDESADLKATAERIAFGKFSNAGQTCIAPDYVLVQAERQDALLEALGEQVRTFYGAIGEALAESSDYAHLISDRHFDRVAGMLDDALQKGATIVEGGYRDAANRLIAPTILTGITTEMRLMEEEIFGPLLPVIPYSRLDDALAFVNSRPKPLAFYIFSQQEGTIQTILASTSAGGTCINDTLLHFVHPELPFGGVNHSGMGRSHGHFGFLTFSNERAVLHQRAPQSPIKLLYPPFTKRTRTLIDYLLKYF